MVLRNVQNNDIILTMHVYTPNFSHFLLVRGPDVNTLADAAASYGGVASILFQGPDLAQVAIGMQAYGALSQTLSEQDVPGRTREFHEANAERILRAGGALVDLTCMPGDETNIFRAYLKRALPEAGPRSFKEI